MKVKDIKKKVAAKVAKGKAKVVKKCGKCAALAFALFALVGCQNPAQRAQTSEICECVFTFNINTNPAQWSPTNAVVVSIEIGNQAQSNETGGNDAGLTASPTTDVKPEIAVGVGGSSAGVGGTSGASKQGVGAAIGSAVDAVGGLFSSSGGESQSATPAPTGSATTACEGGACEIGDCSDCSKCSDCEVR